MVVSLAACGSKPAETKQTTLKLWCIATFPTLFMYIFLSKKIQESFIAGAVKG